MSRASRARHSTPDCTFLRRADGFLKVCISIRLFHSLGCDAGSGGQPCVQIQALYFSRQLLEWGWIHQPVICALPTHPPTPPKPQINDCLSSFAPNHDQDAEAIENVYSSSNKKKKKEGRNAPPCSTKWPVFSLMGLLIRVTLFMCVLNWRWAQAVILEGDQPPCLGLLNLMENLPTAFALSPTDWKQNNLAFRLLSCFDCQIQYITFTSNTQPSHWFLPSAESITLTV